MVLNVIPKKSSVLFLCVVRHIVEKHGGRVGVNRADNAFTVYIPEEQKNLCFKEMEDAVGPLG